MTVSSAPALSRLSGHCHVRLGRPGSGDRRRPSQHFTFQTFVFGHLLPASAAARIAERSLGKAALGN